MNRAPLFWTTNHEAAPFPRGELVVGSPDEGQPGAIGVDRRLFGRRSRRLHRDRDSVGGQEWRCELEELADPHRTRRHEALATSNALVGRRQLGPLEAGLRMLQPKRPHRLTQKADRTSPRIEQDDVEIGPRAGQDDSRETCTGAQIEDTALLWKKGNAC